MRESSNSLDTWRIGAVLGSGRHGMVLRASHRDDDGRIVALKVPAHGASLANEAHALEHLGRHEHIIEVLDGPLPNGALVLEYCERGTLADRVDTHPLDANEAAALLCQMANAIESIHAMGWIHGDITPANIGLRSDGTAVLLDFATARTADGAPLAEGTAEYAGTCRRADQRVDVRCLAASVMASLPDTNEATTREVDQLRDHLLDVVDRCDRGETPTIDDLRSITISISPSRIGTSSPSPQRCSGGPSTPTTREFGPRPGGEPEAPVTESNPWLARSIVALLGIAVAAAAVVVETSPSAASAPEEAEMISVTASIDSFRAADVRWDDGLAVVTAEDGSTTTYAVGQPGDLAALGNWSCNGDRTIGVYRPSTGSWFTFGSWEVGATSSVEQLVTDATVLSVERHSDGCDRPRVR